VRIASDSGVGPDLDARPFRADAGESERRCDVDVGGKPPGGVVGVAFENLAGFGERGEADLAFHEIGRAVQARGRFAGFNGDGAHLALRGGADGIEAEQRAGRDDDAGTGFLGTADEMHAGEQSAGGRGDENASGLDRGDGDVIEDRSGGGFNDDVGLSESGERESGGPVREAGEAFAGTGLIPGSHRDQPQAGNPGVERTGNRQADGTESGNGDGFCHGRILQTARGRGQSNPFWLVRRRDREANMISRRAILASGAAALAAPAVIRRARAANTPGVTADEIKIGQTMPYSGPASAYSSVGKADVAFFKWVDDQGGVAGHKINLLSYDDGYSPPKTVEQVRRLVEQDQVAFLFNTLGTPTNSAIERYCNQRKVPQLFVSTGADKWGNYKHFPWTIGWQPSYRTEAQVYTKYMLKENPKAKLAILYQNDDFGKDYPIGVRSVLGNSWDQHVIKLLTYEVTDPTVDSQVAEAQASGADAFLVVATPKFAAQAIRKVHDLNWKPMFFMTNVAISVGSVMKPAGVNNAIGMISSLYLKDPTDPVWNDDAGMKGFKEFMAKYLPGADITDLSYIYGYAVTYTMWKVLEACNGDFSRANVLKYATSIEHEVNPAVLPGIIVSDGPTNYHPIRALQPARWDGKTWVRFGQVIEGVQT
jgi:branched-chain amino acid transport system substrate-binding protein